MATFTPPPTFAEPVTVDQLTGKSTFNPIWLQWFLSVAAFISQSGTGRLKSVIPVTSTGTYVPSAGVNNVVVYAQGGGGTGGAAQVTGVGQVSVGGGGGAGALAIGLFTSGFSGITFTIGGPGADTTFGTLLKIGRAHV